MKKFFNFSNISLTISLFLCTAFAVIFSSLTSWMVWLSTIFGIFASKDAKDGKWTNFLFDIFSYIIYSGICMKEKYYGELLLSYIVIIMHLFSLIEWRRNTNNKIVIVNKLSLKEIDFFAFVGLTAFLIHYIILNKIGTQFALLNALSTILFLLGNCFCYRRSIFQFYCWTLYELIFIILWCFSTINGSYSSLIFLIGGSVELFYNIIGILNWKRLEKFQIQLKNNVCNKYNTHSP